MCREKVARCTTHPDYPGKVPPGGTCLGCWRRHIEVMHHMRTETLGELRVRAGEVADIARALARLARSYEVSP
jgi:hypothetical protein